MDQGTTRITPELIQTALRHYYTPPKADTGSIDRKNLMSLLMKLPSLSSKEHIQTIQEQINRHFPGTSIKPEDHAVISFIDETFSRMLERTDVDFKVEAFFRDMAPHIAILALKDQNSIMGLVNTRPILSMMDMLLVECIGWSEDLGILGDQYMKKLEVIVRSLIKGKSSLEETIKKLKGFFKQQEPVFDRLEQRLCSDSLESLAGKKGQYYSAKLMNDKMSGHKFPLFIIFMLQGAWYEFLQSIFIHYRDESKEWKQACKLTTALVESLRSGKVNEQQKSLMKVLPDHIRAFSKRMTFDTTAVQQSLADVEAEYAAIMNNEPSDPCDFDLLTTENYTPQNQIKMDPKLQRQIASFTEGMWFYYDNKDDEDEKVARIKLVLNWSDTGRLLFTNHNRRKILEMSYQELAGLMNSGIVRLLTPKYKINELIRLHLTKIINEYHAHLRKQKQTPKPEDRKVISLEYVKNRRQEQAKANVELKKHVAEKTTRAEILRHKSEHKLQVAETAVSSLKPNAWVNLPIMKEVLTPCKLAAYIKATDTYVFVNRSGMKVAEYTSAQLAHLLVTENSEILDTGAEFEDVLKRVVVGLREDRAASDSSTLGKKDTSTGDSDRITLIS